MPTAKNHRSCVLMRFSAAPLPIVCLVALLFLAEPAAADIHSWRDKDGNLHFGDEAPGNTEVQDLKLVTLQGGNSYKNTYSIAEPTNISPPLLMYSTSWCGYCKKARSYFNANGIAFTELDIERNPAAERAYNRLGVSGVPVIIQDDRQMRGFSVASFKAFYRDPSAN